MLAYYVEWHLKEAWRELLFTDEDQAAKTTRDPAAPAERSAGAKAKIARRHHAVSGGLNPRKSGGKPRFCAV